MKRIIKNRIYDTEKAHFVGVWSNGYLPDNFNFLCKELYRKRNGEYFLYMHGGAFTECASSYGNLSCSGWKIVPLNAEQARSFAFDFLAEDVALSEFEPVPDDETRQSVTFVLPTSLVENIRLVSRSSGRKIGEVVADALTEYLSK